MRPPFPFVLVALTAVASLAGTGCVTACTEIGCETGVAFQVTGAASAFSEELPVTLRLCAGMACHEYTVDQDAQGTASCAAKNGSDYCDVSPLGVLTAFVDEDVADKETATIEVTSRDGNMLFQDSIEVAISPIYLNGEGCGETCRSGQAVFTPASK